MNTLANGIKILFCAVAIGAAIYFVGTSIGAAILAHIRPVTSFLTIV